MAGSEIITGPRPAYTAKSATTSGSVVMEMHGRPRHRQRP